MSLVAAHCIPASDVLSVSEAHGLRIIFGDDIWVRRGQEVKATRRRTQNPNLTDPVGVITNTQVLISSPYQR